MHEQILVTVFALPVSLAAPFSRSPAAPLSGLQDLFVEHAAHEQAAREEKGEISWTR
jgi:hypothetical protein